MPDDVHARVLLRDGLFTHGALVSDVDLVGFGHLLPSPLLHQLLVAEELIQLGMNQRDVAGNVLRFLTSGEQFIYWNFVTRCESLSHLPESTFWAGLLLRQLLYDLH